MEITKAPVFHPHIPRAVWALGLSSMLSKIASVINYSIVPLYISNVLGASTMTVGVLEGFVEALSLFLRMFSGSLSDIIHKRRNIIAVGYALSIISRPFIALSTTVEGVFFARCLDRVGNGFEASPREALIGDYAPKNIKGACYGLRETLGRFGSTIGSIITIGLLWFTANNYSFVFFFGMLPTSLALLVLILFVKDKPPQELKVKAERLTFTEWKASIRKLPMSFWLIIFMSGNFMLASFNSSYLVLRTESTGLPSYMIPIVMVTQNLATSLCAYPIGFLSDKMDRRILVGIGFLFVGAANFFLATAWGPAGVLFGVFLWGLQVGMTQSLLVTLIADTCHHEARGTAFGIYYIVNGVCILSSNVLVGFLWDYISPEVAFMASGFIATVACLWLPFIHKPQRKH
ncbi:MFS transporter [Candidatus Bealeia paramacronuclearis]|uniref:MFS transporter n=1 Tax=Candidatus Bealeia paramacronuclearis TaxID=1921001 RepID=A0ABZ2C1H5_9PROT|nr:MFS transporter [Candidatus Bealeia paramacronuclearis]